MEEGRLHTASGSKRKTGNKMHKDRELVLQRPHLSHGVPGRSWVSRWEPAPQGWVSAERALRYF